MRLRDLERGQDNAVDDQTKILFDLSNRLTKLEEQSKEIPVLKERQKELSKIVYRHRMWVKIITTVISLAIAAGNYFGFGTIIKSVITIEESKIEKDVEKDILKGVKGFGGTL